jgi:surfactin family lipopeptide synthetase A
MTELNHTYLKLESDPDFAPEKLKNTYKEFVIEQMIQKEKPETLEYWKRELAGYRRLAFPGTVGKPAPPGESGAVENPGAPVTRNFYTLDLGKSMLAQLNHEAAKYDTSLKHLCFGAYVYMLNMLCYEGDIAAGVVTGNRPVCEDGEKILGCFLNTLPVRVKIPAPIRWCDYIRLVDKKLVELAKYDRLSLFEIARLIGEEVQDQNPIFDTLFNFADFHIYRGINAKSLQGVEQDGFNPGISVLGEANTNTLLDFHVEITSGRLIVAISYSYSLLDEERVKRCCDYFVKVLNMFIREPGKFIAKDEIIS